MAARPARIRTVIVTSVAGRVTSKRDSPALARTPMIVGLCYPSPGPSGDVDPAFLEVLKLTGITHVRCDLHLANPNVGAIIAKVRAAGLGIMPIIEYVPEASPPQLADFADRIVTDYALDAIEVLNEPSRVITPSQYHDILQAVGTRVT